ncbi:Asp-tRNAAsn/Glu-tRNAGln amidotransferase A subunit [Marinactinospora thermotolerans DSM 45154]|uniref:Asp-tRNAAsn/Glu-tRNAGln amidotransferase A subunit n=1 Tax=Marinactinospora thermotolerans DSM 45154 TaxID=1122192 RepID=A0A1T4R0W6_9ACTN|nr:amidase [Marinactinospora thermotolerans]SKA09361.1 Asp-tRNAAsn/Glu-tRNAGln amidotransferase A subunit [Marinactinospora thermotolerans DSM 45154]
MIESGAVGAAGRIAARVATGRTTAVEVVETALETIGYRDRELNAFPEVWAGQAVERAAAVDAAVARGARLPLAGVPIAVKASEGTGSLQARRLVTAGAVPVGSTSVPGPGTEWKTWGRTPRGRTVNPWRHDVTPGGSSAGSAVAVAAGMVPLATASDGAGSTRIPAAWCGVVGYKPTTGLLPSRDRAGLTVGGPIARSVADVRLYHRVAAGAEPRAAARRVAGALRVAWSPTLGFNEVDPEVLRVAGRAVEAWARRTGTTLEETDPRVRDPAASWFARRAAGGGPGSADGRDRAALDALFGSFDLLATPTTPNLAHGHDGPGTTMSVGLTWLFNITGHPAISLPAGVSRDGLPVGVQLVAAHHDDGLLLSAAAEYEAHVPWPAPPT